MIGKLPDTLADRSINVPLRRRAPGELVERLRQDRLHGALDTLRRQAARWAADHLDHLKGADPRVPPELHDRAADNWRTLFAIADQCGGTWSERARRAALDLQGGATTDDSTIGELLLADLRDLFAARGADRLPTETILEALRELGERPWGERRHGPPFSQRDLARHLRPFGVHPKQLRIGAQKQRGYDLEDLADTFSRYLPPLSGTAGTTLSGNDLEPEAIRYKGEVVPDEIGDLSACEIRHVPDVPDTDPPTDEEPPMFSPALGTHGPQSGEGGAA